MAGAFMSAGDYLLASRRRLQMIAEVETVLAPLGALSLRNETHLYLAQLKS